MRKPILLEENGSKPKDLVKYFFLLMMIWLQIRLATAKPPLDLAAYEEWPHMSDEHISPDGKYVGYSVGPEGKPGILFLKAIAGKWHREITPFGDCFDCLTFTEDARRAVTIDHDTHRLEIMELGSDRSQLVEGVDSYQLRAKGSRQWLVYRHSTAGSAGSTLVVRDLQTRSERSYSGVTGYDQFGRDDEELVLSRRQGAQTAETQLYWVTLTSGVERLIWEGDQQPESLRVSRASEALAFKTFRVEGEERQVTLWVYTKGDQRAEPLKDTTRWSPPEPAFGFASDGTMKFSASGKRLYIMLHPEQHKRKLPADHAAALLDVWTYKDQEPRWGVGDDHVRHESFNDRNPDALAAVDLSKRTVTRIQEEADDDRVVLSREGDGEHALIASPRRSWAELKLLHRLPDPTLYLVNIANGTRKPIASGNFDHLMFSPTGRYAVWYDERQDAYFSYDTQSGKTVNMTRGDRPSDSPWMDEIDGSALPSALASSYRWRLCDPLLWIQGDQGLIVSNKSDFWKLDPRGKRPAVDLTPGYWQSHHRVMTYVPADKSELFRPRDYDSLPNVAGISSILISVFDDISKKNGFMRMSLKEPGDPQVLSLDDVAVSARATGDSFGMPILNASHAGAYLVKRMSATEYPNLYVTRDFRSYQRLTDLHPQESYNWYTSELVHWTTFDGRPGEGILYKPEDFDPGRKYPVLVHYYEQLSENLNWYVMPSLDRQDSGGDGPESLRIPWYVSRGYLVFEPDVHYTEGKVGDSIYNYIVSGAQWLTQQPWVDAARLGAEGHSFGGFETYVVLSRSNLFAAAISAAGISDTISYHLLDMSVPGGGLAFAEIGQLRMGAPPWQRLHDYMSSSAVLNANRMTTPLLILANPNDLAVPWSQGAEMFTALWRQNKKAWMLSYEGERHGVGGDNQKDLLVRMTQFFDHYLKGAPPPNWMTEGIPTRLKGIETGLELDTSGAVP